MYAMHDACCGPIKGFCGHLTQTKELLSFAKNHKFNNIEVFIALLYFNCIAFQYFSVYYKYYTS